MAAVVTLMRQSSGCSSLGSGRSSTDTLKGSTNFVSTTLKTPSNLLGSLEQDGRMDVGMAEMWRGTLIDHRFHGLGLRHLGSLKYYTVACRSLRTLQLGLRSKLS